ncbi:MAG: conserved repeat domain protein, partial [Methanolobus sp. T82-4]
MLNFRKTIILASLFLFFILVSAGGASGKVLYNDTISEGDGYQINDYVIDVAEVFPSQESAIIQIYEGDAKDPKYDKLISEDGSFEFEIEGEDVELTVISVYSGVIPQAKLLITVTDDDFINGRTLGVVDGGHSEAEFSGTPVIEITKTVEPSTVDVGDTVTVKISAKNTGDDRATKVVFTDNIPPKFVLEQTFVS